MKTPKTNKMVAVPRIDGPLKVTGQARYAADHHFDGLLYAVPVGATIAKGKVKKIDSKAAKALPGVVEVFTRDNIGPLYRIAPDEGFEIKTDEPRPPFEDDEIRYYGQYVALVVAESFEAAQEAARAVVVSYSAQTPKLDDELEREEGKKVDSSRGKPDDAYTRASVKHSAEYVTPTEVHNTIELHSTVAKWDGDKLELHESTQAIHAHRNAIALALGIPRDNIQVISKFLGSGFGGKLWLWPHSTLAAASARQLQRPVKLVIDRHFSFKTVGHRPRTQQRLKLASDKNGQFKALIHEYATQASPADEYRENCGEATPYFYKVPALRVSSGVARRNQGVPTSMRGPGAVPGLFALESAIDELAWKLEMDPVKLRLLNDIDVNQGEDGKPFSSRHYKECLELGAKKFGWKNWKPQVGTMTDGDEVLGWGVAGCTWQAQRLDAEANFSFCDDGFVEIACGTHDLGTGMYTVLAQLVTTETGIPFEKIRVKLGDTKLPPGPLAGGSMATGSVVPAVVKAIKDATKKLKTAASKAKESPLHGVEDKSIQVKEGVLHAKGKKVEFSALLKKINMQSIPGVGRSKKSSKDGETSMKSFGAHFVEVGWDPGIARVRIRRVVSVIDGGRIINPVPARNQIEGAIVMGIGMAMFEEALYDKRDGDVINSNLADYLMAVHADCPEIDVTFLDYPDVEINEYGARGVGEIGLAGIAAAITSAIYHASGKRVRELPVRIEDLLD